MKANVEPRRRDPEAVRGRILSAARDVFAARGFEGATLKLVAQQARSSIPLIVYHFKTKLDLWRAAVESDTLPADHRLDAILARRDRPAAERLGEVIELMVKMLADAPELHRMVLIDAYEESDRLTWLIDTYVRRFHIGVVDLIREAQADGAVRKLDPAMMRYMILGIAALPATAAEYRALTGREAATPGEIARSIEFIRSVTFTDC